MKELFPTPSAGVDSPLEMLVACHERVRRNCELLVRIARHVEDEGVDEEVCTAAASVMRYFDAAGPDHHRDEEDDLFPALLAAAPAASRPGVASLVGRLRADHQEFDRLWSGIRPRLEALASGSREAALPAGLAEAFAGAYGDHIAEEEGVLLPLARRLLAPEVLAAIGSAMAARRGLR